MISTLVNTCMYYDLCVVITSKIEFSCSSLNGCKSGSMILICMLDFCYRYACLLLLSPLMCQSKAPNNMKKRDNKERSHQMDRIQYKTHQKSIVVSSQTDESHQLIDPVQMWPVAQALFTFIVMFTHSYNLWKRSLHWIWAEQCKIMLQFVEVPSGLNTTYLVCEAYTSNLLLTFGRTCWRNFHRIWECCSVFPVVHN